jgi:uncharacterized protein (TIGR00369 family)
MTSMTKRSGLFWDAVEGRAPMPRAAATLGLRFISADVEAGAMEVEFNATDAFTNPTGNVLGAFLAAMLYDTIGPTLLATLDPDQFQSTLDLNVRFIRPARPGRIIGRGRIVRRDGDVALVEASLVDPAGNTIATATANAKVIPLTVAVNAV